MWKSLNALVIALVAVILLTTRPAAAAGPYVGGYSRMYQGKGYTYRKYSYYSRSGQARYHYAVYHRRYPRYVYYYNPAKRKYWGRYDLCKGGYSKLADCDKRGRIGDIDEEAFPPPGSMPPPEEGMDEEMLPPPEAGAGSARPADNTRIIPYPLPRDAGCDPSL
jgi:hypothetical protein